MLHCREIPHPDNRLRTPPAPAAVSLPADSLARALLLAAHAVSGVMAGRSLGETLPPAPELPAATRAAAQDLAYGALRRYGRGDALLAQLLAKPLAMPEVRALLLCALYRLETRPEAAHTVVDQAVEAAATLARGAFRGLVNGVLRNYLRRRDELEAALQAPAAQHWHPEWWLARLRRAYPEAWPGIVAAGNAQPPMALRVNARRGTRDDYLARLAAAGIEARAAEAGVAADACGVLLARPQPVDALPGFRDGLVSVQDLGAQQAAPRLEVAAGMRVLDACAAPGGKTAHLLERADLDLVALEVDATRARRIGENLDRLGLAATVRVADCRAVAQWWDGRPFARILADVPCSASGVVRRHPDSKWLRRERDIRGFARVQREILEALWPTLAVDGRLLYVTCSVFPEENGEQIAAFLASRPDARLLGAQQLLPQEDHDGFYYALLHKLP